MRLKSSEKLCKFQNSGYCKFENDCRFKHVSDICKVKECERKQCPKRHPKRCRYFFLRKYCKFEEGCHYSHGEGKTDDEELSKLRLEIKNAKKTNEELEKETKRLKSVNDYLKDSLERIQEEIKTCKEEKADLEIENKELKEINDNLLEDIIVINEIIEYLIPGKLEDKISELKETNSILRCLLHQKDCEENEVIETGQESEEMEEQIDEYFSCESCAFKSTSQQGLNIHIGIKHKGDKSTSARP